MKITMEQLESLFYGENTLKDVLPNLKEELDRVSYYDQIMIQNLTDNSEEAKHAANELSGLYGIIVKAYHFSEGCLDIMEPKAKQKLRIEAEKEGKKVTDGTITAIAENEVSQYRRVRSYLLGYVSGLEKSISTIQSILKFESSPKAVSRPTNKDNYERM